MINIAAPLDNLSQKLIEPNTNAPETCNIKQVIDGNQ